LIKYRRRNCRGIHEEEKLQKITGGKDISGCAVSGILNTNGKKIDGRYIIRSIANMHDRSNGLGGGFAAYGIYPSYKEYYAFHLMFDDSYARERCEEFLDKNFLIEREGDIPTRKTVIQNPPILRRYFVEPREEKLDKSSEDDFVIREVMKINSDIEGSYVLSSGKNMAAFKAVGFPEDVGNFYRLEEYKAETWIAHGRFPTNTPGWWGGAHPFALLDYSIVHNGEISSYGINKRYLEMFGYRCTLLTDTEVMAYLFDLLVRRHKLPMKIACKAFAPPFWDEIDRMPEKEKKVMKTIRTVYGSCLVNGPFSIILGFKNGMLALNDRIKLRPLIAATKKDFLMVSSEEAGIREICKEPDKIWSPKAGEPVIGLIGKGVVEEG